MIVTCDNCASSFDIDDLMLQPNGRKLKCSACKKVFFQPPRPLEVNKVGYEVTPLKAKMVLSSKSHEIHALLLEIWTDYYKSKSVQSNEELRKAADYFCDEVLRHLKRF